MPLNEERKTDIPDDNEDIISLIKDYIRTRVELGRLTVIERLVSIAANLITDSFVVLAMILTFLFGSVTLGFYFGEKLGSNAGGFGIVSLIYLALALLMYFLKDKYVEKYLINFMVKRIFHNKNKPAEEAR